VLCERWEGPYNSMLVSTKIIDASPFGYSYDFSMLSIAFARASIVGCETARGGFFLCRHPRSAVA